MRPAPVLLALCLLLMMVPPAAAASCVPQDATLAQVNSTYITPQREVFQESNGFDGLQRESGYCVRANGSLQYWNADIKLAGGR